MVTNKVFTCPKCGEGFSKTDKGKCPNCRTPLKFTKVTLGNSKQLDTYIINKAAIPNPETEVGWVVVSGKWERPKIERFGQEKRLRITYAGELVHELRCPSCQSLLGKVNMLKGDYETKCADCKHILEFIFL